jgi:hypothetical protein
MRMMDSPTYTRIVDIYVKDRLDRPVADAEISFTLNGSPAGTIPNSAGHGSIRMQNNTDLVGVTAKRGSVEQTVTLATNATSHTVRLPVGGSGFWENHLGFAAGAVLWTVALILGFTFSAPNSLQTVLIKGTFSLGCGALATEISGLLDIKIGVGTKVAIAASGALAVFVLLYLVAPA